LYLCLVCSCGYPLGCRLRNAQIDVMCNEWAKASYDICPFVNNTHVYDTEGVNTGADYTEALGVIKVGAASPSEPLASPGELLASPSELLTSPSEPLASPSEL
jgi:hypothetical protein